MTNTQHRADERRHAHHRTWLLTAAAAIALVGASVGAIAAATLRLAPPTAGTYVTYR